MHAASQSTVPSVRVRGLMMPLRLRVWTRGGVGGATGGGGGAKGDVEDDAESCKAGDEGDPGT